MRTPPMNSESNKNAAAALPRLTQLIGLLFTPTWKLRIQLELARAEMEYDAARNAYFESLRECLVPSYEQNQANYWKGRRDALRVFLTDNKEN